MRMSHLYIEQYTIISLGNISTSIIPKVASANISLVNIIFNKKSIFLNYFTGGKKSDKSDWFLKVSLEKVS